MPVHAVSAPQGDGVETVRGYVPAGRTAALLGSSGVGKSTLVNALLGEELLATQDIRDDGRGRHTTTHRQLVPLPEGGLMLDTPGMRELQLWDAGVRPRGRVRRRRVARGAVPVRRLLAPPRAGLRRAAALASGTLDVERYESWRKLQRELERLERKQDGRAQSEAAKGAGAFERSRRKASY